MRQFVSRQYNYFFFLSLLNVIASRAWRPVRPDSFAALVMKDFLMVPFLDIPPTAFALAVRAPFRLIAALMKFFFFSDGV